MRDPATTVSDSLYKPWPNSPQDEPTTTLDHQAIMIGLMMPFMALVLNMVMFNIAVPTIRDVFSLRADVAAWLVTAYTLPFIIFMPFYGRVGDGLGKRRLLLVGILIFSLGTLITGLAPTVSLLIVGRIIQGMGTASVTPLCIAIISNLFPAEGRGKAMGTWNSVGPLTAIPAPLVGGFLIDQFGWRSIFIPIILGGAAAWLILRQRVPATLDEVKPVFWKTFDWGGMLLLSGATILFVFYVSSQPITGVAPLQDWRLLLGSLLLVGLFVIWERRQPVPFVTLHIFWAKNFSRAALGAAIRMFILSGSFGFLMPLYLNDVRGLSAAATGSVVLLHAGALFSTMRLGGQVADRWGNRRPVLVGASVQLVMMIYFALLPAAAPLWLVILGLILHGLGSGVSLAAFHRSSMSKIAQTQMGGAAGLYSMIRFGGTVLGIALIGVVLQQGLETTPVVVEAYQRVFWVVAGVAFLGVMLGRTLHD